MSESILKALMQLFAIIARPVSVEEHMESDYHDRRKVVEEFLQNQLNKELVREYLKVFDHYYSLYQEKQSEKNKSKKRTSSSSVRVLKICSQINEELIQQQKVVVLIQLLEFVKPEHGEVTEQEMAFITTVAETFYIPEKDFLLMRDFVLLDFDSLNRPHEILTIDSTPDIASESGKHLYAEGLQDQIRVILVESANIFFLRYRGNHELYLNGHLLQNDKIFVLNNGASIRNTKVKPIYFSDIVRKFAQDKIKEHIIFEVDNIEYRFPNGKIGIHSMSFTEESGRLVGIMGASGAGKSTLLNLLNGSEKPNTGSVRINGIDIHTQPDLVEGQIGFVSQDDLLIEELTVYQNLYYNARLCFDNYTKEQLNETVNQMLQSLGLFEIKDMRVGSPLNKKISGGQRKRLNIALELIREPAILFLDEPTSGLSSRDSENILDLLKELTLKGKLVFVVIHQPSSDIFKMFDKLLILDTGGYLIYNGDPIESIIYFKSRVQHANWNESECTLCGNVNPEQIFNIVETKVLDEYGNPTRVRKISPSEWNGYYHSYFEQSTPAHHIDPSPLPQIHFKIPSWIKQLRIFVKRDLLSKLANTQYMVINILETPLLAFLLSYIIKYYNVDISNKLGYSLLDNSNLPVYLFMSVIVGIFVGLTVSAEEIIKDRKILKREAFLNLSWSSYLMSKIAILMSISALQAMLFVLIGNSILEIHGMFFRYWLILFSTWFSANMLGLVISDSFKTVVTIYILIPFLVIPQIILSGVIVKYEKLNPSISSPKNVPLYGEVILARWAYEAMAVTQFKENAYQKPLYKYDEAMSIADFKKNYWLKSLQNKLAYCRRNLNDSAKHEACSNALALLRNEIRKEMTGVKSSHLVFKDIDKLYPASLSPELLNKTKDFLSLLKRYYVKLYNKASQAKDQYISQQESTPEKRERFLALKRSNFNESLNDFVRNTGEVERIIEYKSELIQKIDPIYLYPASGLLRSHFYAPVKPVFNRYFDTFWVNTLIIWFLSLLLYITLYFRLVKRMLEWFERQFSGKEKE